MVDKDFILFKKWVIAYRSGIPRMVVCVVKVGNVEVFWKHWTKSDHKHLTRSHSQNMWNTVSLYKLQKEHSGDDFIPKIWSFFKV